MVFQLIKSAVPIISVLLCELFSMSLSTGIFHDGGKIAKIIPTHNGNTKYDLNNYQVYVLFMISNIDAICKVFE